MTSGSGFFTAASLKNLVKQIKGVTTSEDDIVTTYRLFDRQNKGFFARDELKAVLKRYLGKPPTEDELEQIMSMGEPPRGSSSAEKVISKDTFVSLFK